MRSRRRMSGFLGFIVSVLALSGALPAASAQPGVGPVEGWLRWRGPLQAGVSLEVGLPDQIQARDAAWTFPMAGRGTPVIAGGRVFAMGYEGEGPELQEVLFALDERTGELLWRHSFNDYLTDVIYSRYAITSPAIDGETGLVYALSSAGELTAHTGGGDRVWEISLAERFGRLTYPNGRTLGPLIDGDLVILHFMTSGWGPEGPARDRFVAFDKRTGEHVWTSTPGIKPWDAPYSYPVFEWRDGRRMLYAGTACGNMVAVDALTGESVWRFQMTIGGMCASPLLDGDRLIAVHGTENLDSPNAGRLIALDLEESGRGRSANPDGSVRVLGFDAEAWRNDEVSSFSSSPVLAGGVVYTTVGTGQLMANDAATGRTLWSVKLAPDQIHASPLYADGKLYVPMNNGTLHVIRPERSGPQSLSVTQLEGNCLGAPSVWNGRVYVHTTERLYCFGGGAETAGAAGAGGPAPVEVAPAVGAAVGLRIIPGDVLVRPGESVSFRAQAIDAAGQVVREETGELTWPASPLGLRPENGGRTVTAGERAGAATLRVSAGGLSDEVRFRVVYPESFTEDFESVPLNQDAPDGTKFGRTPAHWISGFPKWDVREVGGSKALAKTIDDLIFQRTQGFFGDPDASDYTMSADIMSEGNRRIMSAAGVVNQRYQVALNGNKRTLEISSNYERIKHEVPFQMRPGVWYRLKTRVDLDAAGAATVYAKAWPRDEAEPAEWTTSFRHGHGHTRGAAGIYGFSPNNQFRVYVDNIVVTPNNPGRAGAE